jgi:alpha-tubulin suppressor-like RCC1 family protein
VEHRDAHRRQQVGDISVLGQAGVQLCGLGGEDRRQRPELVEQFVDDGPAMIEPERLDERF